MKKIIFITLICSLIAINSFPEEEHIVGLDGRFGFYNTKARTAYLSENGDKTFYTNIVEYSQAVTPPNIANPKLTAFATMLNPKYKTNQKKLSGGQAKHITLFGIKKELYQDAIEIDEEPFSIEQEQSSYSNQNVQTYEIYGSKGSYNRSTKTAYLVDLQGNKKEYTNIVEYSQAVTPPNIANPKLKPFATMLNPKYKESQKRLAGGQAKYTILYGIEKELDQNNLDDEDDIEIKQIRDDL